jgi:hypothetical protein
MNNAPSTREVSALLEIMAEIGHRRSASSNGHTLGTDEKLWLVQDRRRIKKTTLIRFSGLSEQTEI